VTRIVLYMFVFLACLQSYVLYKMDESLEVADLIIVATEHQRDEARERVRILEAAIIEQNEQCKEQPPRLFRGPYYPEQQPQQNQEDTPPVNC
jgi:hypothetical protein